MNLVVQRSHGIMEDLHIYPLLPMNGSSTPYKLMHEEGVVSSIVSEGQKLYLKNDSCPVCSNTEKSIVGRPYHQNEIFQRYSDELNDIQVCKCLNCSLLYLSPNIYYSNELLKELYNLQYFGQEVNKDFKNIEDKRQMLKKAIALYGKPIKGLKLLDIGCGTGEFLKIASEFEMVTLGIDVNKETTDYIAKKYGYMTMNGTLEYDTFAENSFDFIVLSHVIEHLQQPNKIIMNIYKILKPGGIFLMATPNADSIGSTLYEKYNNLKYKYKRDSSFILTPFTSPYHILGFNKKSIKVLLDNNKFLILYNMPQATFSWKVKKYKALIFWLRVLELLLHRGEQLVVISKKGKVDKLLTP